MDSFAVVHCWAAACGHGEQQMKRPPCLRTSWWGAARRRVGFIAWSPLLAGTRQRPTIIGREGRLASNVELIGAADRKRGSNYSRVKTGRSLLLQEKTGRGRRRGTPDVRRPAGRRRRGGEDRARKKRPPLTMKVVLYLFLCGLLGFAINQNLYVLAIKLTSATFVTAISNLTPATTFLLSILTRLETLKLRNAAGQAKLVGALVGMGGAMLLTFCKGPEFKLLRRLPRPRLVHITEAHHTNPSSTGSQILGSFLAIVSCFSYAAWAVVQAKAGELYPCHYSMAAMVCLFGALQSTVVAVCVQHDMAHWRLGFNIRLYSSAYAGLIATGSAFPLLSWCLRKKGPLFIAVFNPLMLIFVAVLSSILLDEALYLGSGLGSILIVCGLYLVLWGKAKEQSDMSKDEDLGKKSTPVTATSENGVRQGESEN